MSWKVLFSDPARRQLSKLPREAFDRVIAVAETLAENPRPRNCKKMRGADTLYRLRVGVYRLVYEVQDGQLVVVVVAVGHRREVYR